MKTNQDKTKDTLPAQLGRLATKQGCYRTPPIQGTATCSPSGHLISLPVWEVAFVNHTC